ncbi:flippase-like domain-containing protein [Salipiger bermudensis]|uniref:lysylphosphatidylglycerol synthase transmembrane domain-containing protein n=1 Tax=Salipiger bermudensis TaxID=344736 RepID=UPI001C98E786|nr:lysylphosphatidylglycerol synthase transmembrane domain-containing protein [Salipiger bermudensis]MBY6005150.1 flippase-like domain-containing protein [Salipiger bermudensis]
MRWLRILLPLALIALCLWLADGRAVLARLSGLSLGWFVAAMVALHAVTLLSALRWTLTARALSLPLGGGEAVREYYLAQFVNQTLPGGVLGDAARAMRSRKGGPMRRAAQAVVLERASGQAGMALVAVLGLVLMAAAPRAVLPANLPSIAWLPLGLLITLLLALVPLGLSRAGGREDGWRRAVKTALLNRWAIQAGLSLSVALLTVAGFGLAARATGSALAPATALLIVPLILTAMLLPASVAGWGWREGAAASLFAMAGLGAEAGIAASIAFGLAMLLAALPGAFFLQRPRPEAPQEAAKIASPSE